MTPISSGAPSNTPPQPHAWRVMAGTVSLLTRQAGRLNLLAKLQHSAGLVGLGLSLGGMPGAAATAVSTALYDGEDVENFGLALGEDVVVGTFENVSFEDGDEIKAVVSTLHPGVYYAHAVVRVRDGLLWMPYNIDQGRRAMAWSQIRFGAKLAFGLSAVSGIIAVTQDGPITTKLTFVLFISLLALVFCWLLSFFVYLSSRHEADYAECIFKVLGFKNPSIVNLTPFSMSVACDHSAGGLHYIFKLREALAAYGSLSKARPDTAKPNAQAK